MNVRSPVVLILRESAGALLSQTLACTLIAALITPPALGATNAAAAVQPASYAAPAASGASLDEQYEVMKAVTSANVDLDSLGQKILEGSASNSDRQRYDELIKRAVPLRHRQNELPKEIGAKETLGVYTTDDHASQPATLSANEKTTDDDTMTPEQMRAFVAGAAHGGGGAIKNFSMSYLTFSMATGFMAMSQLMLADPRDPNALEQWEKQTFNLMGAVGFGAFMMGQHSVIKTYQLMRGGSLHQPPAFINYLGMSAGMIGQSLFSDVWNDADVWKCIRPYYDSKAKPTADACMKARDKWSVSGKIMQYAPSAISMLGASAIVGGGQFGIKKLLSTVPESSKGYLKIVVDGFKVMPKSAALRTAGKIVGGPLVASAEMVAFLTVQSYWVEEPVNRMWQDIRDNHVDLKAWADNHLGFHSEFLWPKSYQPISDALDVEATTPSTAHQYLMELYRREQANGWKKPAPVETCVPVEIAKAEKTASPDDLKNLWFWQRWGIERSREKSETQLQCEVFARPGDLLNRYSETGKDWRGVLLSPFSASQSNWVDMVAQFSESYAASYALANELAKQKYMQTSKGQTQAPDLSREHLAQVIQSPLPPEDDNADHPQTHQSWFLDGTWIPTPELVDYVAAGAACGSDPVLTPGNDEGSIVSRVFHTAYSAIARKVESPNFISTPYGSSLRFVPPKLTSGPRAICQNAPGGMYATVNYLTGNHLPDLTNGQAAKNPFSGTFTDEHGKAYTNLAQYAYDNLDPELYKATLVGYMFANWWQDHFIKVIQPVWTRYDVEYQSFVSKYYVPALFDRSFRDGCRAALPGATPAPKGTLPLQPATNDVNGKEQVCTDSSNAYRVSNGVLLAIETEMRNYLRGWYSLYAAALGTNATAAAKKAEFVRISNALLAATHALDANTLRSPSFTTQAQASANSVKQLQALVTTALQTDHGADSAFRGEMNTKFGELVMKLLTEESEEAQTFRLLQFTGNRSAASVSAGVYAPLVGPVQNLDGETYSSSNLMIPE